MYKKIDYTITKAGSENNKIVIYCNYYKVIDFVYNILEYSVLSDYIMNANKTSNLVMTVEFDNTFEFSVYDKFLRDILESYITLEKCHDLVYENMEDEIHGKV